MRRIKHVNRLLPRLFPFLLVVCAYLAFRFPAPLCPLGKYVPYLLGGVMLGMGLTITPQDFRLVLSRPRDVMCGVCLRTVIMPLAAYGLTWVLPLSPSLAAGLILVGCCPSGTASNVMTYIAKGDTALSITMTSVITLLAPVITPCCFLLLAGSLLPINASALFQDIFIIVIAPVLTGLGIRTCFSRAITVLLPLMPLVSILSIIFIVSIVVALSSHRLAEVIVLALAAVVLHNGLGLALSCGIATRLLRLEKKKVKAITFEVGIENSGLAVTLALAHLDPIAAVPGALFSVWHNITGSCLAGYWAAQSDSDSQKD